MTSHVPLLAGVIVGLSIAVPVGPMSLLCIRRTLASGLRAGMCTGLGAATVNVFYGALILAGLGRVQVLATGLGRALGFAGGLFLLWSAVRTLLQPRAASGLAGETPLSAAAAYGSAVAFNATNPLSPVLTLALLSPLVAQGAPSPVEAAVLLLGMFAAASAWWLCLTGGVTLVRARLGPGMLATVNQLAAVLLTVYGAVALARSLGLNG